MVILNTLFEGKESFRQIVNLSNLNFNRQCLVRMYSSIFTQEEMAQAARDVKEVIPMARIIGCSCCGVVYHGEQFDDGTLVIVEQFDQIEIRIDKYDFTGKTAKELAQAINDNLEGLDVKVVHILLGNHYMDIHQFVAEFNRLNGETQLIGGGAGEILPKNLQPYVLLDDKVWEDCAVTASFLSHQMYLFTGVNTSVDYISSNYRINQCNGEDILEIEHTPAVEWCKNIFGVSSEENEEFKNDILTLFPLILERNQSNDVTRFIRYQSSTKNISLYCSKLDNNLEFKIGYVSPFKCVQRMYHICNEMRNVPLEGLFFYSCLFRKSFLGNCSKWETRPFGRAICGVFMMGEICSVNHRNEFLNGSCCFLGIGEDPSQSIDIDFRVFDDLYKIKDENERILNAVLKNHTTAISEQNKELLERVIAKQSKAENILYIDTDLQISNNIKFINEKHLRRFNKICMIQMENSELIFSRMEREEYFYEFRKFIDSILVFTDQYTEYHAEYEIYSLSDTTIFLAFRDEYYTNSCFLNFVNSLYEKFQFIKLEDREEMMIFRFAVAQDEENLLECALEAMQKCKGLQTYFFVYDRKEFSQDDFSQEMEIIHMLNEAIEHDWIVPYFQGIYDNRHKTVNKYEALIRIRDHTGRVYPPGYFMDVAKKYNMYVRISKIMIGKVVELFKDKKTSVSINISAYDVNSKALQEVIFQQLEKSNHHNFIFELLEDECFRDIKILNEFIQEARKHHVKVAIDDFGSGYSNFMEIARMVPDFIKIDGSIIKNIAHDEVSRKVLNTIVFLCKQLNSELVAEFVENEDIQSILEDVGVHFSQGYYFCKPEPYEMIQDRLE